LGLVDRGSVLLMVYTVFSAATIGGIWHQLAFGPFALLVVIDGALLAPMLAFTALAARRLGFSHADEIAIVLSGSKKSLVSGIPMANVLFAGPALGLVLLPLMVFHQIQRMACAAHARRYANRSALAGAQAGKLRDPHPVGARLRHCGSELVEQRFCVFEVGRREAFGEPAVDGREEAAGFGAAALVAAKAGEARGGTQFPELRSLFFGNAQGFAVQLLSGLGMSLSQQQLAFMSVQLGCQPALPCPFDQLQRPIEEGHGLLNLPCDLTCPGQEGGMIGHPGLRPGGAENRRPAAEQQCPFGHITIFDLAPSAIDGSLCRAT
jgi:hypothetical protein